jgi:hypothetical protein
MTATHLYFDNPAAGRIHRVRFIRWFDTARRYARVEFENGRRLAVPSDCLAEVARAQDGEALK